MSRRRPPLRVLRVLRKAGAERALEGRPVADLAVGADSLRPVGIVERQHFRLGENIGRAETGWMARIALDLRRPPLEGGHDDAAAVSGQRQRGRVVLGNAWKQALGHVDVRQFLPACLGDAVLVRPRTSRRERCGAARQQLQRPPARELVDADWPEPGHRWHTEQSRRCVVSIS